MGGNSQSEIAFYIIDLDKFKRHVDEAQMELSFSYESNVHSHPWPDEKGWNRFEKGYCEAFGNDHSMGQRVMEAFKKTVAASKMLPKKIEDKDEIFEEYLQRVWSGRFFFLTTKLDANTYFYCLDDFEDDQVALISVGGEAIEAGYIGNGMITGLVSGLTCTEDHVFSAIKHLNPSQCIVISWGEEYPILVQRANAVNIHVAVVTSSLYHVLLHKVLGAAATSGKSLAELQVLAADVIYSTSILDERTLDSIGCLDGIHYALMVNGIQDALQQKGASISRVFRCYIRPSLCVYGVKLSEQFLECLEARTSVTLWPHGT